MSDTNQEIHPPKTLQPEDIIAMKGLGQAFISSDGKWVAFIRSIPVLDKEKSEHRSHIWLVSTRGDEPFQLTNGPNGDSQPQWSPDSTRLAFVSKRNGDKTQIWILPIGGGEAKQLTHAKNGVSNPQWSPDGKQIAFLMREKDDHREKQKKAKDDPVVVGKDDFEQTHLWLIDVETMNEDPELLFTLPEKESDEDRDEENEDRKDQSQRLTEGDFHVGDPRWSPDGKQIVFVSAPSPKADDAMFRSTIQILDVKTKAMRKLTQGDGSESMPRWSPNGSHIAFIHSPEGYGQADLHLIEVSGTTSTNLTNVFDRSANMPMWSVDGEEIFFDALNGVRRHLYVVPKAGGEVRPITRGDCVITNSSLAMDGDTYACHRQSPNEPSDLWLGSIRTDEMRPLTKLNPQIADFALGETRVIQWKSSDGLEIEGLLVLPVAYEAGKRYPLYVEPHGGPRSSRDLAFKTDWQYFSGEGFAVFGPNFRGGDGYGRDFARSNLGKWGVGDYWDIMTGVDHLIEQGIADPDQLVVGGWSYGGYMTAWIVTQSNRFKAAMFGCGIANTVSMYGQTDIPSFMEHYFGDGAPPRQLELYRKQSPMSYVDRVKTPTLILHGAEDVRVPLPQSEEFYAVLKAVGVEVEFVKYPREGHGIGEPRHRLDVLKRQLEWFGKYLE